MESIGPVQGSTPYWDMHADDGLCWRYTAIMVVVQVLAFGRVHDNRVQRRDRKAAKAERERSRREGVDWVGEPQEQKASAKMKGGLDGAQDSIDEGISFHMVANGKMNGTLDGAAIPIEISEKATQIEGLETESESSLTETSEEEMMI